MKSLFLFIGTYAIIVRDTVTAQLDSNLDLLEEIENEYDQYYL